MLSNEEIINKAVYFCNTNTTSANRIIDLRLLFAKFGVKFTEIIEKQGLYLAMRIAPDMPRFFMADEKQILDLINNIAYYTLNHINDGGLVIDVKVTPKNNKQHRINISVTASGLGIPPQMVKLIFQPSCQEYGVDSATLPSNLHIAKCVTKILGGDISVQSSVGWGTRYEAEIHLEAVSELAQWN